MFPLDGQLNLSLDCYAVGLHQQVAYQASLLSYDNTAELVQANTAGSVSKRQARELMIDMKQDFEPYYKKNDFQREETNEFAHSYL